MKTLTVLLSIALYLAVIDLSYAEQSDHHDHHKQMRHRPKRQYQSDYIYHPSSWYRPRYPEAREDKQDLLPHIYRLLEEISDLVRRPPPPPPQPIYIPYPVQYPYPRRCKCPTTNGTVTFPNRFPEMEDENQNWGYDDGQENDDEFDNSRPINFDPIPPPVSTSRPPPKVDHGSSQASVGQGRVPTEARRLKRCDTIVLACCDDKQSKQKQRSCFNSANCDYGSGQVCSDESVQEVLKLFALKYAPKQ